MAFPTISTVLDNFNRAAIGTNWTANIQNDGALIFDTVTSTVARAVNNGNSMWWNPATFGADCETRLLIDTWDGTSNFKEVGLYARLTNPGTATSDGYIALFYNLTADGVNDALEFKKITNGVRSQLGATINIPNLASGDEIGFELIGTTLTAYRKVGAGAWTSLGTRTDSTYSTAGYLGISSDNAANRFDNFVGGSIVGAFVPQIVN